MGFMAQGQGDMNALAMKVVPTFSLGELMAVPVGAHVLMLHIDQNTGRMVALEGFEVSPDYHAKEMEGREGESMDQRYSSTLIHLDPVTDEEASQIADRVLHDHLVISTDDIPGMKVVRDMLMAAAKLGRGLDA